MTTFSAKMLSQDSFSMTLHRRALQAYFLLPVHSPEWVYIRPSVSFATFGYNNAQLLASQTVHSVYHAQPSHANSVVASRRKYRNGSR